MCSRFHLLSVPLFLLVHAGAAVGQSQIGTIKGTVSDLFTERSVMVQTQCNVENFANRRFGNPFSGTHFGYPRLWSGRVKLIFK